jgi:hypothetical protein
MASVIKIKRSTTPGSAPSTLAAGEIAVNIPDRLLFVGDGSSIYRIGAQYLSVANAVATYATKSNPATSGFLAHTGRATISTNLAVSGNTTLSGTLVANNSAGVAGYYLRTSGTGIYWSPVASGSYATWSALTTTNTALRTLISNRLQVANAATLYTTKQYTTLENFTILFRTLQ